MTTLQPDRAHTPPGGLQTVHDRHPDVQEQHVGRVPGDRGDRFGPVAASATTSMSACASRIMVNPLRTSSWSSATPPGGSPERRPPSGRHGQAYGHAEAAAGPTAGDGIATAGGARSRMPIRPCPPVPGTGDGPRPSSVTVRVTSSSASRARPSRRKRTRA